MNLDEYAIAVSSTKNPDLKVPEQFSNWALGITGEAGEVAEIIKKHLYHGKELNLNDLEKEMGDVLYYIQAMCNLTGLTLAGCMAGNADKLKKRYPTGFVAGGGVR